MLRDLRLRGIKGDGVVERLFAGKIVLYNSLATMRDATKTSLAFAEASLSLIASSRLLRAISFEYCKALARAAARGLVPSCDSATR